MVSAPRVRAKPWKRALAYWAKLSSSHGEAYASLPRMPYHH